LMSHSAKRKGIFSRLSASLEKSARKTFDYPNSSVETLTKDVERALGSFKSLNHLILQQKAVSELVSGEVKALERDLANSRLGDFALRIDSVTERAAVLEETLTSLLRKVRRLRFRLGVVRSELALISQDPIAGLSTLLRKATDSQTLLVELFADSQNHVSALEQLRELEGWASKVQEAASKISAGFSEIGCQALFAIAYGVEAPKPARRWALSGLIKWSKSVERVALNTLLNQHLEFAKSKKNLDRVEDGNLIAFQSARKLSGIQEPGEEFMILLEALRITSSAHRADSLLWVANYVAKFEKTIFADSATNEVQISWINEALEASGRSPLNVTAGSQAMLDRFQSAVKLDPTGSDLQTVSVIMPAYNSEQWISSAIQSLLAQTWVALEVLVVDDCSTDSTYSIAKSFEAIDQRVRVLRSKQNSGPYHCRNLALKQAKGIYVTVHDADDWSHPQKIQVQVEHLEANPGVVANVSEGARVDEHTLITGVSNRTQILRPNFSSLMFRRSEVADKLGFWDEVRFGADSEFQNRLITCFGQESFEVVASGVVSFLRVVEGSLTAGGVQETLTGARSKYKQSFTSWHQHLASEHASFYLDPAKPRRFFAPRASLGVTQEIPKFDLVVVADFSVACDSADPVVVVIKEALAKGLSVAIGHVPSLDRFKEMPSNGFEVFALDNSIEMTWHLSAELEAGSAIRATRLMVTHEAAAAKYDRLAKIEAQELSLLVDGDEPIDSEALQALTRTFTAMFGAAPKLLHLGEEAITAVRDIKWMAEISDLG